MSDATATHTWVAGPAALRRHVRRGNLLHGSPCADLAELIPQALTHDPQVDCAEPVVYATADPVVAVLFALLDRERWCGVLDIDVVPGRGASSGYLVRIDAIGDPLRDAGTVWVVDRADFGRLPGRDEALDQWASRRPVIPVARVGVTRADLGVAVGWVDPATGRGGLT